MNETTLLFFWILDFDFWLLNSVSPILHPPIENSQCAIQVFLYFSLSTDFRIFPVPPLGNSFRILTSRGALK